MIRGFSKTAEEQDIYNILQEGGLPAEYNIEKIKKNDTNGQLTINSLDSAVCLSLTNHIHGKQFFDKKVFVTSVVQKTPSKDNVDTEPAEDIPGLDGSSGSGSSSDESDEDTTVDPTKAPCSKLFTRMTKPGKRSASVSPEVSSENKKKGKKNRKDKLSSSGAVRSSSRHGNTTNK